jgi:hypothetical protein
MPPPWRLTRTRSTASSDSSSSSQSISWAGEEREATLATIRSALDDETFAEASERGRTRGVDAAAALALDALGRSEASTSPADVRDVSRA